MRKRPPCVLLDRDGTLIEDRHYLSDPDQVTLIPGAAKALARMNAAGYFVGLVTNQSGVARGRFAEETIALVHERLKALLAKEGAHLDAIRYCPHHPDHSGPCVCRKPAPGMGLSLIEEFQLDPHNLWVVGDKLCDVRLGEVLGGRGLLVRTGHGQSEAEKHADRLCEDLVHPDLARAVEYIFETQEGEMTQHSEPVTVSTFSKTPSKVVPQEAFVATLLKAREEGKTVVFTNGCFDLLHVGHLRYLEAARSLGDILAVAVNSDSSVTQLKGETRPLVPEDERQEMLAGLSCVTLVTQFSEETPYELIRKCRPKILVKGADWAGQVVGTDLVEADGGRLELVELVAGRSSTEIIRKAALAAATEGLVEPTVA